MAKPSTTHVIEIDTGIGEPAFIPLTLGQELQPISVGKKGMWRIESPRVMDVHAFVYFDGSSLFLQSADEAAAATVDGYKIGKAWTELHAPCKIEIGTARLRYRSLLPDGDSAATVVRTSPPVQAPRPVNTAEMRALPQPPPPDAPPLTFPKADRPFRPGEFSAPVDDENTRIAPVAPVEPGAGRVGTSGPHVRPAAGRPPDDGDLSTRPEAAQAPRGATGAMQAVQQPQMQSPMHAQQSGPYAPIGAGPMQGATMQQSMPPGMGGASMPPGMGASMPPMGGAPPGYPGPMFPSASYPQYPPNAGTSGSYSQPMAPPGGPSLPPGGFGSMTPQAGSAPKPQNPIEEFAAKWKEMSVPKRVAYVLLPIAMILATVTLFTDDDAPAPARGQRPAADAGATVASVPPVVTTTPPVQQPPPANTWPKGVPCPPPNWPPNVPLPCVRDTSSPPPPADSGTTSPPERPSKKDAGAPPPPPSVKTLERQAVDAVAAGNKEQAAQLYEELARRDPNNRVYAEAARILRQKLDAGVQ